MSEPTVQAESIETVLVEVAPDTTVVVEAEPLPAQSVYVDAAPGGTDVVVEAASTSDGTVSVDVIFDYPPSGPPGPVGPEGPPGVPGVDVVDTASLQDGAVTTPKIADDAVTSAKIEDGAIGTSEIADGSVINGKLAANSVDAPQIIAGAVGTFALADASVTTPKLADGAVTAQKLAAGAVTGAAIATGAVSSAQIADGGIQTIDLADGSVTAAKLAPGAISGGSLADGSVSSTQIADGGIQTIDLADGSVTTAKIAGAAVTGSQIAASSITSGHLVNGAVTNAKIANQAVDNAQLAPFAVTANKIANQTITSAQLADGAVTTPKLGAGAVDYTKFSGPYLALNAAAGASFREIQFFSTASLPPAGAAKRWTITANSSAESGGNNGSDFGISRYDDAGALLSTPIFINRANGGVTVANNLQVNGTIVSNSTIQAGSQLTCGGYAVIGGGTIYLEGPNAGSKNIFFRTNGSPRWAFACDSNSETGSNAGSNFVLYRYDDGGNYINAPFQINRSNGIPYLSCAILTANAALGGGGMLRFDAPSAQTNGLSWYLDGREYYRLVTDYNNNNLTFQVWNGSGGWISDPIVMPLAGTSLSLSVPDTYTNSLHATNFGASGTLTVSGAASIGGTLNVGGAITAASGANTVANQVMVGVYVNGSWYNAQSMGVSPGGTTGVVVYNNSNSSTWSMAASDRRLKENIQKPSLDPLALVRNLPIWSCDYISPVKPDPKVDDPEVWTVPPEHWSFSFMADEVEAALPNATIKDEDGVPIALHPQHLIATLWAAVQQLTERLEAAEAKLAGSVH
jgi:hypothetical protein